MSPYKNFALALVVATCLAAPALAITGNWSGRMQSSDREVDFRTYRFAPSGHLVLEYLTRQGPRQVEIRQVGQTQEWQMPGSGIAFGKVETLRVENNRVQAVVSIRQESGGGSLLDQSEQQIAFDFVQEGETVRAMVIIDRKSYASGSGLGLYAAGSKKTIWRGVLKRAP